MKVDNEKLEEVAMAMLSLTRHEEHGVTRVWKGLDWDLLDALHARGWISNPVGKAKSVVLTPEGEEAAEAMFKKHFEIAD